MPREYEVEIKGVSPYLMHRFAGDVLDRKSERKTGRKDYKGEIGAALYIDETGVIYVPSRQLEGAFVKAATDYQIVGRGKKTYKDLARSAIIVLPNAIPIEPQTWVEDAQPVVVQKSRITRYRPRWDAWKLKFRVQVMEDQFAEDVIKQILDTAGTYKGIGDFRPKYGRFIVTRFHRVT